MRRLGFLAAALFSSSCATTELNYSTSSGRPERTFYNSTISEIKNGLIDTCIGSGMQVEEQGNNSAICYKTLTGVDAMLGQVLVGGSYSTALQQKARFTMTQRESDVFVIATGLWIETQMPFGQTGMHELTGNHQLNDINDLLHSVIPPRLVGIGIQIDTENSEDGCFLIERVFVNSPADQKNIQSGDCLLAIGKEGESPVNVSNMSSTQVLQLLGGRKGTTARLVLLHNEEILDVSITRDEYELNAYE